MNDLEITRLCAEAMGWHCWEWEGKRWIAIFPNTNEPIPMSEFIRQQTYGQREFDPLHDDAQAMVLEDYLLEHGTLQFSDGKAVFASRWFNYSWEWNNPETRKRGLCECVAKMQASKALWLKAEAPTP